MFIGNKMSRMIFLMLGFLFFVPLHCGKQIILKNEAVMEQDQVNSILHKLQELGVQHPLTLWELDCFFCNSSYEMTDGAVQVLEDCFGKSKVRDWLSDDQIMELVEDDDLRDLIKESELEDCQEVREVVKGSIRNVLLSALWCKDLDLYFISPIKDDSYDPISLVLIDWLKSCISEEIVSVF